MEIERKQTQRKTKEPVKGNIEGMRLTKIIQEGCIREGKNTGRTVVIMVTRNVELVTTIN